MDLDKKLFKIPAVPRRYDIDTTKSLMQINVASTSSAIPAGHPMDALLQGASGTKKKPKLKKTKIPKKSSPEYETRLAHLPANLCFICKKNSKKLALVQCDYCPLLFHLDCLYPPLTSLPVGKWMCPNHVEHRVDLRLASSLSMTTRTKIWNKFNGPVKQEAIKLKFLNKVNKPFPPFKSKRKCLIRNNVPVPAIVFKHYKSPPPYLPRVQDPIPSSIISRASSSLSDRESSDYLRKVVKFQIEVIAREEEVKKAISKANAQKESNTSKEPVVSTSPALSTVSGASTMPYVLTVSASSKFPGTTLLPSTSAVSDITKVLGPEKESRAINLLKDLKNLGKAKAANVTDFQNVIDSNETQNKSTRSVFSTASGNPHIIKIEDGKKTITTTHNPAIVKTHVVPCNMSTIINPMCANPGMKTTEMTPKNISVMAGQAKVPGRTVYPPEDLSKVIQHASSEDPTPDAKVSGRILYPPEALSKIIQHVWADYPNRDDVQLKKMDGRLMRLCAYEYLKHYIPKKETPAVKKETNLHAIQTPAPASKVRARAVLVPLDGFCESVTMSKKTMHLGLGAAVDLCFNKFGHCNFVSAKHATIFYDEYSKQYELLNYSCYGTTVDNVHYSSDVNKKKPQSPNDLSTAVHRLYNNSSRLQAQAISSPTFQASGASLSKENQARARECRCPLKPHDLAPKIDFSGCEGAALLHHGSYIRCGCLQFVFSITECGYRFQFAKPHPPPPLAKTKKPF